MRNLTKAVAVYTMFCFMVLQLGSGELRAESFGTASTSMSTPVFYDYTKGFATVGYDFKNGEMTQYTAGKIDYTYRIGEDGGIIMLTDYSYDEQGRIDKITDCTTGKYIQYGEVKNAEGETKWLAVAEYNADGAKIGEYRYDSDFTLMEKDLINKVNNTDTVTGRIFYENGKPSKQVMYYEQSTDSNGKPCWNKLGSEVTVKTWTYGEGGKLVSSVDTKKDDGGNWYSEETKYDDKERAVSVLRDGVEVGTFEYSDLTGVMTKSTYTGKDGLVTNTSYDKYGRVTEVTTIGKKTIEREVEGEKIQVPVTIETKTVYTYNDTSQAKTLQVKDKDGTTKTITVRAGALASTKTHSRTYTDGEYKTEVNGFWWSKIKVTIKIDETVDKTDYYENGDIKATEENKVDNGYLNTEADLLSTITSAIVAAIAVIVAIVVIAVVCIFTFGAGAAVFGAIAAGAAVSASAAAAAGAAAVATTVAAVVGACGGVAGAIVSAAIIVVESCVGAACSAVDAANTETSFQDDESSEYNPANVSYSAISLRPPVQPPTKDEGALPDYRANLDPTRMR